MWYTRAREGQKSQRNDDVIYGRPPGVFLDRRIGLARLKMGINASVSLFFQPKSPPTLNLLKYFSHFIWKFRLLTGSNNQFRNYQFEYLLFHLEWNRKLYFEKWQVWWSWNFNLGLILVNSFMFWKCNICLQLNPTSKKIFYFYSKSNSFIIFADFFITLWLISFKFGSNLDWFFVVKNNYSLCHVN